MKWRLTITDSIGTKTLFFKTKEEAERVAEIYSSDPFSFCRVKIEEVGDAWGSYRLSVSRV